MERALGALDNWFYNGLGSYSLEAKCEILAELKFSSINFTLWSDGAWNDVPHFGSVRDQYGIDVNGVYAAIGGAHDHQGIARVADLISTLEGTTQIELAIIGSTAAASNSDAAGDDEIRPVLERLLELAQKRGITLALYPHSSCWLETLSDGVRLCEKLGYPNLKLVFSSYHWFLAEGRNLHRSLERAMPYLNSANICGTRRVASDNGLPATIELIDQGALDNFYVLGVLENLHFDGTISLQGYAVAGDAYTNLRRSYAAFRDIEQRLAAHPGWVDFKQDPLPNATGIE